MRFPTLTTILGAALLAASTYAHATLAPKTPAQLQAAADKKAKDDAQAALDKQALANTMDAVAARWRARAAHEGWTTHAAVALPAAPAPATAPTPAAAPAPVVPIQSEKLGTAAPSADVKQHPTLPQPKDAPPTVVKKDTPQVKNR